MEYKAFSIEAKSIEGRKVTGFASIFGNVDSYGDIVHKGAFKKTIEENRNRFRHLWMHDAWQPPTATIVDIQEVGKNDLPKEVKDKFPDATGGLLVAREYLTDEFSNRIFEGIQKNAITEMSFGYDVVKTEFETSKDGKTIRHLKELKLFDTSDVNWGANDATVASKSYLDTELQKAIKLIEALSGLKAGRVISASNMEKLKQCAMMLNEVMMSAEPSMDDESMKSLTEQVFKRLSSAEIEIEFYTRSFNYV